MHSQKTSGWPQDTSIAIFWQLEAFCDLHGSFCEASLCEVKVIFWVWSKKGNNPRVGKLKQNSLFLTHGHNPKQSKAHFRTKEAAAFLLKLISVTHPFLWLLLSANILFMVVDMKLGFMNRRTDNIYFLFIHMSDGQYQQYLQHQQQHSLAVYQRGNKLTQTWQRQTSWNQKASAAVKAQGNNLEPSHIGWNSAREPIDGLLCWIIGH